MKSFCSIMVPDNPVPKERARSGKTGFYTPAKTVRKENEVKWLARRDYGYKKPSIYPIKLDVTFYVEIPESWPKWKKEMAIDRKILPTSKPDSDNLEKLIMDAMSKIVYKDDAQVVQKIINIFFAEKPYTSISVIEIDAYPASIKKSDIKDA